MFNVFTGSPAAPTFNSYKAYSFGSASSIELVWAAQLVGTTNIAYQFMDFSAGAGGKSVILPDATKASIGQFLIFHNASTGGGASSFAIKTNTSSTLMTLGVGEASFFVLIDNTTQAGTWRIFPFGGGTSVVTSVGAVSLTTPGLTITGSPITTTGTFIFSLADALNSLAELTNLGFLVQTEAGVYEAREIVDGTNIDIADGDGILNNPVISLSDTLANLVSIDVGNFLISNNTILATSGAINIVPNGANSIFLGGGVTPPTISSAGNLTNVVNLNVTTTAEIANIGMGLTTITSTAGSGNLTIAASGTGNLTLKGTSNTNPLVINTNNIIFHPSIPKATARFRTDGTIVGLSYNVTSVTKNSTGQYTVNIPAGIFTTVPTPFANSTPTDPNAPLITSISDSSSTTAISIITQDFSTAIPTDPSIVYFMAMGG